MSFFSLASQRMRWLGTRQAVITQNIANADTPGFKAKDVSGFDEMLGGARSTASSGLRTTDARHMTGAGGTSAPNGIRVQETESWEQSLDGNTVALEEQSITAVEVSESYRMAAALYRKGHDLLTLAVTGVR
ncbi:flagellar basal body rod protein FlgB [Oceanicola sp. 22II-s10i]|uniref:flagellar basal body rod protein FlgB n=1 Tax=Oceanicola sp. 22II-s10i TaxID=1317116 RepID=UPI0020CFD049|nr:flagellar basal body rod protein FlgB [Oceanicola sp. 22II-s10i]